jgi:hypothetical protein
MLRDARKSAASLLFLKGGRNIYRIAGGLLVLVLVLPAFSGDQAKDKATDKDKLATPAERFKMLDKEYQNAMQAFQKAHGEAKTDDERQKVFQEKYPRPDKFAPKFLALAEENPKDAVAVDALIWVVTRSFGAAAKDNPRTTALAILTRDHIHSEKLGQVCQTLVYSGDKESGLLLRALLEKNPHKAVQGQACLALAQHLNRLRGQQGQVTKEVEDLFERAAEKYGEVKTQGFGTIGEKAKSELFEIRFLAVGKIAPDIEGEDQDGKKFKLSDYKGKVVLLDFWSQY